MNLETTIAVYVGNVRLSYGMIIAQSHILLTITFISMIISRRMIIVHTVKVTAANQHDVSMTSELLTGEESVVYGDSGYLGAEKREDAVKKNANGKRKSSL